MISDSLTAASSGTWQLGSLTVNRIDTAAFYFSALRSANELLKRALRPWPDDLVVATKVGPARDASGEWLPWARAPSSCAVTTVVAQSRFSLDSRPAGSDEVLATCRDAGTPGAGHPRDGRPGPPRGERRRRRARALRGGAGAAHRLITALMTV